MSYSLTSGSLQLLMGFLGRFVRRKILLGLGMTWLCSLNLITTLGQNFQQIFLCRTLAGIGASPQHPTGSSYIVENFSERSRGKALGINIAGAQIGNSVTPLLGSLIVVSFGWRVAVLAFTLPGLLTGIAFLMMKEPKRSIEWMGGKSFSVLFKGVRNILSNQGVIAVIVLQTVMAFRMGADTFLPSYFVKELGMTPLSAGILFTTYTAAGIPAPYLWGYLSDRFERIRIVMISMSAAALFWSLLPYSRGILQLALTLASIALTSQGIGGVIQAYLADSTVADNRDLMFGIYFTISFGIGSLSPAVLGYIADKLGFVASFTWVAFVSALAVVVAGVFFRHLPSRRNTK